MTNDTLKIDIADWADKPLGEIETHIRGLNKRRLGDLKFLDLLVSPDKIRGMRHGVYMFFDEKNKCVYIGKCSSSHFAHRLGAHFAMSPHYGMNTFLRKIVKELKLKNNYASYVTAVEKIHEYRYLMIVVNTKSKLYEGDEHKKKVVGKLEKIFMTIFEPEFNKFKKVNLNKCQGKNLRDCIELHVPKP